MLFNGKVKIMSFFLNTCFSISWIIITIFILTYSLPVEAKEIVVRMGWKTSNKNWEKKDIRWLKSGQKKNAKWRKNEVKWEQRDRKWIRSNGNPAIAWPDRERRWRIYDGG